MPTDRSGLYRLAMVVLVGVAFALRLPGLFANTFHPDEALFAAWARHIAVWRDPLLAGLPVDKPPLLFYLQALFYPLFGPVAWAARLPGFLAGLLLIPLLGALARRLGGGRETAVFAAAFLTLSPLAIQFSPTAYLDPLLTLWLVAGLLALAAGRPGWTGFFFGMAAVTKYQAWLFFPLLAALAYGRWGTRRAFWRGLGGVLPPLLALLAWNLARPGSPGLWAAQMDNFGGLRLSRSWELWPRLAAWGEGWWYLPGSAAGLLLLAWGIAATVRRGTAVSRLFLLFLTAYAALHWLLAIPPWERYLLPALPLLAILAGASYQQSTANEQRKTQSTPDATRATQHVSPLTAYRLLITALLLLMLPAALDAAHGRFPIGGFPEADRGAAAAAAYLENAPYGTVLYDHWYSWQWRYHFFDKGVHVSWTPHPAALARDLRAFGDAAGNRYLAMPETAVAGPFLRAVHTAGFRPIPVAAAGSIVLYQIEPSSSVINAEKQRIREGKPPLLCFSALNFVHLMVRRRRVASPV
jgi:4-amino-4-deoxy-L-arabinose transferase-like glycosyltransferase